MSVTPPNELSKVCAAEGTRDRIATLTLSQLLQSPSIDGIDILKIDIEGSESRFLCDSNSVALSTKVRYIVAEIHPTP
jgi:methyltransferase, FkbM family